MMIILFVVLPILALAYNNPMDKVGTFDLSTLQINQEYYLGKKVKDYTLLIESGFTSLYKVIGGKATIIQLAYYTCDSACPLITENALKKLKDFNDTNYNYLVVSLIKKTV